MLRDTVLAILGRPWGTRRRLLRYPGRGIEIELTSDDRVAAITWVDDRSPLFVGDVTAADVFLNGLTFHDQTAQIAEAVPGAQRLDDLDAPIDMHTAEGIEIHTSRGSVCGFVVHPASGRPPRPE
jgi:hypothetical protein